MKVRGTDTFSDDIPIVAARLQRHFLLVHDIFQLATYFTNLKSGKKKTVMKIGSFTETI